MERRKSSSPVKSSRSTRSRNVSSGSIVDLEEEKTPPDTVKKRGRKPKVEQTKETLVEKRELPLTSESHRKRAAVKPKSPEVIGKKKRGRKPKTETKIASESQVKITSYFKKKAPVVELDDESEEENEEADSDDEFKPDKEEEQVLSSESDDLSDEDMVSDDASFQTSKSNALNSTANSSRKYNTRRSGGVVKPESNLLSEREETMPPEEPLAPEVILDVFDVDAKIEEWQYELEPDSKCFYRPRLPSLTDKAILPFMSSKSKPPKVIFYECPFCQRPFTYPLVFKNHLYSCTMNKNVPSYVLTCCKKTTGCEFTAARKQEMINHFAKFHLNSNKSNKSSSFVIDDDNYPDESVQDNESSIGDDESFKLTKAKQNQYELSKYSYINRRELTFASLYFNKYLFKRNSTLKFIDEFAKSGDGKIFEIEHPAQRLFFQPDQHNLRFKVNNTRVDLKPFEFFSSAGFKLFNLGNQVTSIDWCPQESSTPSRPQYLAISTLPFENLEAVITKSTTQSLKFSLLSLYESFNLIFILKTSSIEQTNSQFQLFSLLHRSIGLVSCLKWRRDFGAASEAQRSQAKNKAFLGYLLAASSNGNGYIFHINEEPDTASSITNNQVNKLVITEPNKQIILKQSFSFGQCTSADWSSLNGSVQVAIGYANGTVALYQLNSSHLSCYSTSSTDSILVYPVRTFSAHFTFVKSLKWSKLNSSHLASGSLFSREIKLWDLNHVNPNDSLTSSCVLEQECFVNDFEFSLHSNNLFVVKESSLKGENHLLAFDLSFGVFNQDRDESKSHSSLFSTNATQTSISQSDYLNKLIVCDTEGNVIMSRSNDTKYWFSKYKMMGYSFARVIKFTAKLDPDSSIESEKHKVESNETVYNINSLENKKSQSIIEVNFDRIQNNRHCQKVNANPMSIDLSSLCQLDWNPNLECLNWYAGASMSGFVFFHQLDELNINEI